MTSQMTAANVRAILPMDCKSCVFLVVLPRQKHTVNLQRLILWRRPVSAKGRRDYVRCAATVWPRRKGAKAQSELCQPFFFFFWPRDNKAGRWMGRSAKLFPCRPACRPVSPSCSLAALFRVACSDLPGHRCILATLSRSVVTVVPSVCHRLFLELAMLGPFLPTTPPPPLPSLLVVLFLRSGYSVSPSRSASTVIELSSIPRDHLAFPLLFFFPFSILPYPPFLHSSIITTETKLLSIPAVLTACPVQELDSPIASSIVPIFAAFPYYNSTKLRITSS